jgi:hypothetical protein
MSDGGRRFVDLHAHSTASDGSTPPAEVVARAERDRLYAVALTDHDTTAGLAEAAEAARPLKVRFVPGVEVSARRPSLSGRGDQGSVHVVGLGVNADAPELVDLLERLRDARAQRNPRMIRRLRGLGFDVTMEELREVAGKEASQVLGRLHMAELLRRKGYVRDKDEAFARYLREGRPAYVDKERIEPADAIAAIGAAGGVAVLAHPGLLGAENDAQLERYVGGLAEAGLEAVEVYHSEHSPEQTRRYLDMARRLGLLVSGGSDYHGTGKPGVHLGRPAVPRAAVEQLLARLAI